MSSREFPLSLQINRYLSQAGKVRLIQRGGSVRILAVPQHPPAPLDKLLALAQGYADFSMRNIGHVPPALLADSPKGVIQFVPHSLKNVRAKDNFANTTRLICLGYEVTAAVLVLEAWMKMAWPGETLDMTEPPSEAFDRREVVVLTGETVGHSKPVILVDGPQLLALVQSVKANRAAPESTSSAPKPVTMHVNVTRAGSIRPHALDSISLEAVSKFI